MKPTRVPSTCLPDTQIIASEKEVQEHPAYAKAKAGDLAAAVVLSKSFLSAESIAAVRTAVAGRPVMILGVAAMESQGVNEIPQAMAFELSRTLGMPRAYEPLQINRVGHTRSSGWHRLASQAVFDGAVVSGGMYWLVDDFVGQGGTLANLGGYLQANRATVAGITVLAGRAYSAKLAISAQTLQALRTKHGQLEEWWIARFGFGFGALTESEGRYLYRAEDADTIRNRLAEAAQPSCR